MTAHVGDIGVVIRLTLVDDDDAELDISDATDVKMVFVKPNGSSSEKAVSVIGLGTLAYSTIAGDFSVKGSYKVRGHIVGPTYDKLSNFFRFVVRS